MYTYKKFTLSFRDPQEAAKREKRCLSVIACRKRKALAEAAAAAKVVEGKEETKRKHAQHILKSMVAMAKKYAKKRKPKKRKHDTSSEDSSSDSDSDASGEVSSHSDKKWKKKEKRYRRSPTPHSPTPPLTVTKRKATSPPPYSHR